MAAVTQALPGPTTRSTGGRPSSGEPEGEGADRLDAARDEQPVDAEQAGGTEQDRVDARRRGPPGEATTIAPTPATRAGTTVITSDDG